MVLGDGMSISDVVSQTYGRNTPPKASTPRINVATAGISRDQSLPKPAGLLGGLFGFAPGPVVPPSVPISPQAPEAVATTAYRTVCVRLCDGSYFPVSFSTTRDHFRDDEAKCQSGCDAPSRLFVYATDGGSPETMEDLNGTAYMSLATAFKFRAAYDPACKCHAHPWEQEALARHARYASAEATGTPDTREPAASPTQTASPASARAEAASSATAETASLGVATSSTRVLAIATTVTSKEDFLNPVPRGKKRTVPDATAKATLPARSAATSVTPRQPIRSASAYDVFRAGFGR